MKAIELIPELMRFYGGSVTEWLNMRVEDVRMFVEQMQKIKAREKLEMVDVLAYGFGLLKESEQRRLRNEWQRQAGLITSHRTAKLSPEQQKIMLASMGVKLEWPKKH